MSRPPWASAPPLFARDIQIHTPRSAPRSDGGGDLGRLADQLLELGVGEERRVGLPRRARVDVLGQRRVVDLERVERERHL